MDKVMDINSSPSSSRKPDRKTVEKNRRIETKGLCLKLTSLVPPHHFVPSKFVGAIMGSSRLNIQTENGHIGMPSNICCVVVEYLPGGALKSYLIKNRRWKLAFKVVVQTALDLARGLSYLHSQDIVHRDVKTENMLLDKTRAVNIADFGVARVEASNPNDMTGETGTLGYMAPEFWHLFMGNILLRHALS